MGGPGRVQNLSPQVTRDPWMIPKTGILVGRTCRGCLNFVDAEGYWRNGKAARYHVCAVCAKRRAYWHSRRRQRITLMVRMQSTCRGNTLC